MGKDAFLAWCKEQSKTAPAPQFLYDKNHKVTGVMKRVDPLLLPVYEALRQIESPVLPRILDIREQEGALLITEEYIEGKSLRYLLDEEGAQEDTFVIRAAKDILEALSILHNRIPPIIHRDIKPENIILRDNGRFVLIDFDAARGYSEAAQTDTVNLGTHGYAAPEQYGFAQTDARSDIYSLGVLLYELRMGKPYGLGAVCDGSLEKIIRRCTQFEAKNRYQSAKEADIALGKLGKGRLRMVRALVAGTVGVAALCAAFFLLHKPNALASTKNTELVAPTPGASPSPIAVSLTASPQAAILRNSPEVPSPEPPQESSANAPVAANVNTIPCTCRLQHPSSPETRDHYLPQPQNDLPRGKTVVKTLGVRPIRISDGCKAEVHDEPKYTFSLAEYVAEQGFEEMANTEDASIIKGNKMTVSAPGKYYIDYETTYHSKKYNGRYSIWMNDSPAAVDEVTVPCTCTLEHPITREERNRYSPEATIGLRSGQTLVETLKVRPIRISDNCNAEVHDEPVYSFVLERYTPPKGEAYANTVGPDIVQGNKITISQPGDYLIHCYTTYHNLRYEVGFNIVVYSHGV
ncbi:MAG: serine/threonine-protein kinase [Candidatus Pelethousia sp.]|nr:serine/threonine-protein kinase [Candidatus Pelethousia sp.]